MAYTSVLPVHRLERSIDYVKDRTKTTKSAGSLEEAIDYALNREKTEETIFEDAIGCTCENAYADMVKTKERFHKKEGVQGYHLVQSFAEGEVCPEPVSYTHLDVYKRQRICCFLQSTPNRGS